jgi:hypothetical protein
MPSYSPSTPIVPWPDLDVYDRNRAKFTEDDLKPYDGQWVAFSSDGSRLVAGHHDLVELKRRIEAAGFDPNEVWLESVLIDRTEMLPCDFPE